MAIYPLNEASPKRATRSASNPLDPRFLPPKTRSGGLFFRRVLQNSTAAETLDEMALPSSDSSLVGKRTWNTWHFYVVSPGAHHPSVAPSRPQCMPGYGLLVHETDEAALGAAH